MHKTVIATAMSAAALAVQAQPAPAAQTNLAPYTIDVIESLGRVSAPAVSPDGKTVLFGISYEDLAANSANNDLYTISVDGRSEERRVGKECRL